MSVAVLIFVLSLQLADFTDPTCDIDLECAECLADNMPLVTAGAGAGGELRLACPGGRFLLYPARGELAARCEGGRLRVRDDGALRHLLDLACQESVLEDVLHHVEHCGGALEGRAYQMQELNGSGVRHLATLCFDPQRVLAVRLHTASAARLPLAPHAERTAPLTLLGNFNHMFDLRAREEARQLYGDEARLQRRLEALLRPEAGAGAGLAGQRLAAAALLAPGYFPPQLARVADFPSNQVASWRGIVEGNLRLLQQDVAELMRNGSVEVYAGTHGAWTPAPGAAAPSLRAGGRFPVPRYVWTVVARGGRAAALVLLNDPLVRVSEVRAAVFCESACGELSWAARLRAGRAFERPAAGLVFCCDLSAFSKKVKEMPDIFGQFPLLV